MNFLFKRPTAIPKTEPPKPAPAVQPLALPTVVPVAPPIAPIASAPAIPSDAASKAPAYRQDHKSLYKQLLRGLYDAVFVTDPKGHVIDSNGRVPDAFQFDKNEVWDMEISKLIPGITPPLLERVKRGLAENRHVLIDARCIRKDGTAFPAEVAISTIDLINDGDMVFSVRNVERRKRQSQLLRSLQNALGNDLSSVAVGDREGKITYASPMLRTLWGIEKDEQIMGKALVDLWPGDAQKDEPLKRALAGERWQGMLQATALDGHAFKVGAAINLDRGVEPQEITGFVCSFVEVQES